jgi:glycosyltransferase involved in cell wall biosynthesis
MRILYVASGIPVPGSIGGSTHAFEVARGLARRGHDLHLVAASHEGWGGLAPFARPVSLPYAGFQLHQQDVPKPLALLGAWPIRRLAAMLRPDAIIERYYNFAGAGLLAARRLGIPCLLEVNALIIDPPAVFKRRLDDALGGPMRRWALAQCRRADCIITPLHTTVPPEIPPERIVELPWGASLERFANLPCPTPTAAPEVLFLGSFRAWHGAADFVQAAGRLIEQGRNYRFRLIGDGPERRRVAAMAAAWPGRFEFSGSIPYDAVPAALARANLGVAPFNTAPHPALRSAGFFWSPLKIFEYMAAGLPVVTTDIAPLNRIVRPGCEGALFREGDSADLARAIDTVLSDRHAAHAMGERARARVAAHYSWERHCAELEAIMQRLCSARL